MKHNNTIRFIAFCLFLFLLSGCREQPGGADTMGSEVWESMPQLTYGILQYEKLQSLDWNSGRCEATSYSCIAETELGFYCAFDSMLFYSDKDNSGYWIPVCSKPECEHNQRMTCEACIYLDRFVVRDGRIYYEAFSDRYRQLVHTKTSSFSILSKAPNGSDVKFACSIDEAALANGGKASTYLSPDIWLYYVEELATGGSTIAKLFAVTDLGTALLHQETLEYDSGMTTVGRVEMLHGDAYYQCSNIYRGEIFRIENNKLLAIDRSLIPDNGGYVSGNTLRVFRRNDGYYDINIETLEEVKVADAQLTDSDGQIYLPNCIVESTLLVETMEYRADGMTHSMKIFDGETWRSVNLPPELLNAKESAYVYVASITSDSIIFEYRDTEISPYDSGKILYTVSLESKELVMEQCGVIQAPQN